MKLHRSLFHHGWAELRLLFCNHFETTGEALLKGATWSRNNTIHKNEKSCMSYLLFVNPEKNENIKLDKRFHVNVTICCCPIFLPFLCAV